MPSVTIKTELKKRLKGQIYAKVKAELQQQYPLSHVREEFKRALRWPSVTSLFDSSGNVEDLDHVAKNILSYIERNLRKSQDEMPSTAHSLPLHKQFDARHAVSYALALDIARHPQWNKEIEVCQQHYWEKPKPPFPWLDRQGQNQRTSARAAALDWLNQQVKLGKMGKMKLEIRLSPVDEVAIRLIEQKMVRQHGESGGTPVDAPLTELIKELQRINATIDGLTVDGVTIPHVYAHWNDFVLLFNGQEFKIHTDGTLQPLHVLCHKLGKQIGWSSEKALAFVLCGEPPMPAAFDLTHTGKGRIPKTMSLDHTALLQLLYMTPGSGWAYRLRIWDGWLKRFPEEGLALTFQNTRPTEVTSDAQRAKWLASECRRAFARAKKFYPYVT